MNKLGRSPLGDATYQISRLYDLQMYGFRQEDLFKVFPFISLCKTWGLGHFWPQGYNLNKIGKGSQGDATYKALGLVVSDKKIFSWFSLYKPMLNM